MNRQMHDSEIPGINLIPAEWSKAPLKTMFTFTKGLSITKENLVENGTPVISYGQIHAKYNSGVSVNKALIRFVPCSIAEKSKQSQALQGGFIFADTSEDIDGCGNCVYIDKDSVYGGYHTIVLNPSKDKENKYYGYLFTTASWRFQFRRNLTEVKLYSVSQKELKRTYVIVPPAQEQKEIVHFLDRRCAAIDVAIAKTKKTIDKLNEYKKSVITATVTKGLNPNAVMKDSGIDWIGKVPETWRILRGKFILTILSRPVKPDDDVITCFRDGEVTLRKNRRTEGFTFSDKEIGYQGIEPGDLVVHGMDGFAGSIGISDSRGKATPVLNVMDSTQNKKYLMYYLRSMAHGDVFNAIATGIRVRSCNLNWNKLAELAYPVPPREEQDEIVRYIDRKLFYADELIAKKQMAIEKLEEYRKSLIYHAVTGKIDCRSEEGADHV